MSVPFSIVLKFPWSIFPFMASRLLQWQSGGCPYCPVTVLRQLRESDPLPDSRRGLFPNGIQSHVIVITHYYGPVKYLHVPLYCSSCASILFHNFVVPGPRLNAEIRMELAGDPAAFKCLQTGLHGFAFGVDFLRYFESLVAHTAASYLSFLGGYALFWQAPELTTSQVRVCFARAHMLFAMIDFLGPSGCSGASRRDVAC